MKFLLVYLTVGFVDTFVQHKSTFYHNYPIQKQNKVESWRNYDLSHYRSSHRVYLSKRSQLNGYPKPRKKHKEPPWSYIFKEEVEKEPLGPPYRLLAKDIQEGKRRPRFTLKKTQKQMYATIVDDVTKDVLCFVATNFRYLSHIFGTVPTKDPTTPRNKGGTVKAAYELGKLIGRQALSRGISKVFFDRNHYRYHGRVEALAIGARKVGLDF